MNERFVVLICTMIFAGCAHTPYNRAYVSKSIADRTSHDLKAVAKLEGFNLPPGRLSPTASPPIYSGNGRNAWRRPSSRGNRVAENPKREN